MKIFLTGATGFIGSHVARLLVSKGYEVYALIRPKSDGEAWRIADIIQRLKIVSGDLCAVSELARQLDKIRPDICLHLAWYAEPGQYLTDRRNLTLLEASLQLAVLLANLGCKKFIGCGTCIEYDVAQGYLSENSPTNPKSLYAAAKLSLSLLLPQLVAETEMDIAWLRLFYMYGPFEDKRRLVASVINALLQGQVVETTPGEQVRDFLHVEDMAAAIEAVAESDLCGVVNVGSGQPVTIRQVIEQIGKILGRSQFIALGVRPYREADPMFICANNQKLKNYTKWEPHYNLEQGLTQTIEWWQKHT